MRAAIDAGIAYALAAWLDGKSHTKPIPHGALPESSSTEPGTDGALCDTICQEIRRLRGRRTVPLEVIVW
jgi:hypothetical protein